MSFTVQEIQSTPNPHAKKFVLDRTISPTPLSFRTMDSAAANPLAKQLMGVKGVSNILLLQNFVTIGKTPEARWAGITPKVRRILNRAE